MDRNLKKVREDYDGLARSYTKDQRHDVQTIRDEIGWGEQNWLTQPELFEDEDSDIDWVDEGDGAFHALTISVGRHDPHTQTWSDRLARERFSWEREMPDLYESFLAFMHTGPPQAETPLGPESSSSSFSVMCIDLTKKYSRAFASGTDESVAVTLMRHGYIPPTPISPSCAIHIDVLRFSAALRRNASSISLQGIAASIYGFENEVASRRKVGKASGANTVPARSDVPALDITNVAATSNSATSGRPSSNSAPNSSPKDSAVLTYGVGEDQTQRSEEVDGNCESHVIACEERWKNARADDSGKKVVVFDETGIFAVSCRHGSVMIVEDMRRSGELSKYGLAAVDKLCRVLGNDILIGYDIGCTFRGTVQRSPLVGPLVRKHNMSFCVGSFHGYAHNRKCQLTNHPMNLEGAGTESFEECETLFSSTNSVALTTRHSSPFHRRQHIVLHLSGWDLGRRCALGAILKSKYVHALRILETLPLEIQKLNPNNTDDDWRAMFHAERDYFDSLKAPSSDNSFAMLYVKRLRVLAEKQATFDKVFSVEFVYMLPSNVDYYRSHPDTLRAGGEDQYQHKWETQIRQLEAQRTAATEQLLAVQTEVAKLEEERGINVRWTPGCAEWEAAEKREALDEYHQALRNLESLVVQRIAELEKSHSARTGYKVRVQMAKGIKRRERAVHSALARYNKAAMAVKRETLGFKELTDHAYLANFDFLKYSEHGAQDAEWSRPVNRRCVEAWQKIERAREEITRLNIEIRRVYTHLRDEEDFLAHQYNSIKSSQPALAHALLARMQLAVRANQRIRRDLESISSLKGFTGKLEYGRAKVPMTGTLEQSQPSDDETSQEVGIAERLGDMHEELVAPEEIVETEPTDETQQEMYAGTVWERGLTLAARGGIATASQSE
ncbi:hypothetical protein FRC06_011763, partial [Ceratobasidium sp. 370]